MEDHIYKVVELVGSSTVSFDDAVGKGLERAGKTLKNLRWFEIGQIRGQIADSGVAHWQVTMKVGFTLEDKESVI